MCSKIMGNALCGFMVESSSDRFLMNKCGKSIDTFGLVVELYVMRCSLCVR